jgi:hypothetical protein
MRNSLGPVTTVLERPSKTLLNISLIVHEACEDR